MGYFLSIPILALAAVLQVTVTPRINLFGGHPDLVFLLVVAWGLNSTLEEGLAWAFIGSLCTDLLSAAPLGTSAVGLVILIFLVHALRQQIYRVGVITLIWVALFGTFFQHVVIILILSLTGFAPAFAAQLGYGVLVRGITAFVFPTMVYNLIVILPIYGLVRRLQKRIDPERFLFT